jgi:hypothetical protein
LKTKFLRVVSPFAFGAAIAALAGCTQPDSSKAEIYLPGQHFGQAIITAPAVLGTVTNPNNDAGDKVCAVLNWGIPIAESRSADYGPHGLQALAAAKQITAAGCQLDNANWIQRAVAASAELVNILWGI